METCTVEPSKKKTTPNYLTQSGSEQLQLLYHDNKAYNIKLLL